MGVYNLEAGFSITLQQRWRFEGLWSRGCTSGEKQPHPKESMEAKKKPFPYRFEATTPEGFLQQLTANYLAHGYFFYVTGWVPEGKDPCSVDAKLLAKYGIALSPSSRARRKRAGSANLHYLRYDRLFLLLATHGHHPFFAEEAATIRDARRVAIQFGGHSIRVVRGDYLPKASPDEPTVPDGKLRVRVLIARERYAELKAHFLESSLRWSAERFASEFMNLPYVPYAPVRRQLLALLGRVNRRRKEGRLEPVPWSAIRYQRPIVKPFDPPTGEGVAPRGGVVDGQRAASG